MIDTDDADIVKKIRILSRDSLPAKGIVENFRVKAMMEILLELCDENLDVLISESECLLLLGLYEHLHRRQPFDDLKTLILDDIGVSFFFVDLRELVAVESRDQRHSAWTEIFVDFNRYLTAGIAGSGVHSLALQEFGENYVNFQRHYELMRATLSRRQVYNN